MKPKKLNKKLSLNKTTVTTLNGEEMNDIYAGQATFLPGEICVETDVNIVCGIFSISPIWCTIYFECPEE